jgi:hypothetical protein
MKNMAKTFQFERFDVDTSGTGEVLPSGDGEWIRADAAIDREAVNAAKIRTLEVQLSERGESRVLAERKPTAWVRYRSDGGFEGPIMDTDERMCDTRRKSGAWTPLYAAPLAQSAEPEVARIRAKGQL